MINRPLGSVMGNNRTPAMLSERDINKIRLSKNELVPVKKESLPDRFDRLPPHEDVPYNP